MWSELHEHYPMDHLILSFDRAMRTLSGAAVARRASPARSAPTPAMSDQERAASIALMRVNHAGEVAAQALYQGQAMASRSAALREKLSHAADEELDHLAWTRERVHELGGRTSLLDPLWYGGAWVMGVAAGALGDKASLGFLQATEEQVEAHLATHLDHLPATDTPSRAIVQQMKQDEASHAQTARTLGAAQLPRPVQNLMRMGGKVMTRLAAKI
jgi:3-demethoxyubiquinol 3-hydroxylase